MKSKVSHNKFKKLVDTAIKYQNNGQFELAMTIYAQLREETPENSKILFLLGSLYGQMGQFENCIGILKQSLQLDDTQIDAYNNLAIAYELTGRLDDAIHTYEKALQLSPKSTTIHSNLGDLYRKKGDYDKSIHHIDEAFKIAPTSENVLLNKANLLGQINKLKEAHQIYQQALSLYPNNVKILSNFAALLQLEEDFDQAEILLRKAIDINPDYPLALSNLGNILIKKEMFKESEEYLTKAITLNPSLTDAYINLGFLNHNMAKFDNALKYFNKAIELEPGSTIGHWYRSFTLLLTGKLDTAWDDYEYGLNNNERNTANYQYPTYNPETLAQNKAVLITAEQGVGDQLMFASCLPEILKLSSNVVIECDKRLEPIFKRSFPCITTFQTNQYNNKVLHDNFPEIQQKISCGSLPRLFRRSVDAFPKNTPYIIVDKNKLIKWKKRYARLGNKLKIGISWQGGVKVDHQKRSMLLMQWEKILKCDCHFINLQYGNHANEIKNIKEDYGITLHDWDDSDSLKDLDDFCAKISALDLVISVGNTNVHLAGSLNIPAWCLIPHVPSWRWLFNGEHCLWYPSVKIYRQKKLHDWQPVLESVKKDLELYIIHKTQ